MHYKINVTLIIKAIQIYKQIVIYFKYINFKRFFIQNTVRLIDLFFLKK